MRGGRRNKPKVTPPKETHIFIYNMISIYKEKGMTKSLKTLIKREGN